MIGAAARFRELMTDLLLQRALAGGLLHEMRESEYAAELERCWWAMSTDEQEDAEAHFNDNPPATSSSEKLLHDRIAKIGSHDPPRQSEAA
jgi:hypothetical protein